MNPGIQVRDRLHGPFTIMEPLVKALIASPSMQRLRHIDQAGYFHVYHSGIRYSRFEHSLGVYILLTRFGATLRERVAGLLHDVSHSAFSHCIDYVLAEGSPELQDHQDNVFATFVENSELPGILASYGFSVEAIVDHASFSLLERDLPELCADRIDYSLRSTIAYRVVDPRRCEQLLAMLNVVDGEWVFSSEAYALEFAELFAKMNRQYFAGKHSALMFARVGSMLRYALDAGYITARDLYTTDEQVLARVQQHVEHDSMLARLLDQMNNRPIEEGGMEERSVVCKSRVVDPLYLDKKGTVHRLSDTYHHWKVVLADETKPKTYTLKVL